MADKNKFSEKLRYGFDNIMAKGTPALMAMLGIIFVISVVIFSLVVWGLNIKPEDGDFSLFDYIWRSLMRTLDPGTMGGDSGTYGFVMLGVTVTGIFILSALIGIINNGLEVQMENLRKGRSKVIETGHTVILGWSDQIFTIISELVNANANLKKSCIVVMADKDKVEMEEAIADKIDTKHKTRIVCRSGLPMDMADLSIANIDNAKAVIIISDESSAEPDSGVIKSILAITNNPDRKNGKYHIVAELRNPKNVDVARIVGKDELEIVMVGDLISRITAQTCRQSGLSVVYTELLDVEGDEIYLTQARELTGKKYGETLFLYEDSAVMGIVPHDGVPTLNPPMDTVLRDGDKLVVIASDDDATKLSGITNYNIDESKLVSRTEAPAKPEKTLILGWNWRATTVINELDNYVAAGSNLTVVADSETIKEDITKKCSGIKNMKVQFSQADSSDRKVLDSLNVTDYDHIIILCYSDSMGMQEADSKTLITLLHLRDISDKTGKALSIVSEMLDIGNRDLAEVAKVNDFIVSDKLISLLLTQIAENKLLNGVFTDMFDPDGSEIYLKPASRYVKPGSEVNFYTVLEAAKRYGETAIGYKIESLAHDADSGYGVKINPEKSKTIRFTEEDKVVVLAE